MNASEDFATRVEICHGPFTLTSSQNSAKWPQEHGLRWEVPGKGHPGRPHRVQAAVRARGHGARPLHRPREFDAENRRNKKLMSRDGAWHKPQYHVAPFYPATPDGWLVKGIKQIVREEAGRVGLRIKVVEESGTSLGSLLTRPDLSGCLLPDCRMSEVVTTGERPLTRQLSEAQRIANDMRQSSSSTAAMNTLLWLFSSWRQWTS